MTNIQRIEAFYDEKNANEVLLDQLKMLQSLKYSGGSLLKSIKTTDELRDILTESLNQPDVYAKALTCFVFREVIETARKKYGITNTDIEEMTQWAYSRASLWNDLMIHTKEPTMIEAIAALHAIGCKDWGEAKITDSLRADMDLIGVCEKVLMLTDKKATATEIETKTNGKVCNNTP